MQFSKFSTGDEDRPACVSQEVDIDAKVGEWKRDQNLLFFGVVLRLLAKAAGAEPAGQMRDEKLHAVVAPSTFRSQNVQKHTILGPLLEVEMSKKCTPLWREAHFQVKMCKTPQLRSTFRSCDVEKVHAVVARSTFGRQNVPNTPFSDHFWQLRCRKSARRCGAKHIWTSKCTNTPFSDHFWQLRCRKSARRCGAKHIFMNFHTTPGSTTLREF